MLDDAQDYDAVAALLLHPPKLWTRAEVLVRPTPVPAEPGIYGWHFTTAPSPELDAGRLLYVGIAPKHMSNRTSKTHLRQRVRYHFNGNAEGSTLRLTLGCLLGLQLRRVGSGKRMTFGPHGEKQLNDWMQDNARVCWQPCPEPWIVESAVIGKTDLPLNLDQNRDHPFRARLATLRRQAKQRARELPILT
ncbi:GIY-YIG nuclease family protein [Pseudonocardia hispaniensis]|uniref:GIY-YIG nuclease family protein n=1 Tax=Pseudonocardia hispaniensis TaxID=904933 RepID=A0ABW1IVX5_9PSEU